MRRSPSRSRAATRLAAACPSATAFLGEVARHGGHLGGTTTRLLHLLEQHGPGELEVALAEAHTRGAFAAHSVAHILDQRRRARRAPSPFQPALPDDPRVRDLDVTPHALASYDVLAEGKEPGHA